MGVMEVMKIKVMGLMEVRSIEIGLDGEMMQPLGVMEVMGAMKVMVMEVMKWRSWG